MRAWLLIIPAVTLLAAAPAGGQPAGREDEVLRGTWVVVSSHLNEREVGGEKGAKVVIGGGKLTFKFGDKGGEHRFEVTALDPARDPKEITLKSAEEKGAVLRGIYQLKGDELKLCVAHDADRPKEFAAPKGPGTIRLYVLRREKE
jgi:uncharacterized protein (TIGR03067 family)